MPTPSRSIDVAVVGGGAAGLSAALTLGRACRRVLVATSGPPRNAAAERVSGFVTRDGMAPRSFVEVGREQLSPYDVAVVDAEVSSVTGTDGAFELALPTPVRARKVIFATGVSERLPDLPGVAELWGKGVFNCLYCHGWEVADRPLGLLGRGSAAVALAKRARGWSAALTLFTDGPPGLSPDQEGALAANGVTVRSETVLEIRADARGGLAAVVLDGGGEVPCAGLFLDAPPAPAARLALSLGCSPSEGGGVEVGRFGYTSVPGVFVAGDLGPGLRQVVTAAASGARAAFAANHELLQEEFAARAGGRGPDAT